MEITFYHPEFEEAVREQVGIYDRPVTEDRLSAVTQLDLWNFDFRHEDMDTLSRCSHLKQLVICIGDTQPSFWHSFPEMEALYLECLGEQFDFSGFSGMNKLAVLTVSGGDYSNIAYVNPEALIPAKKLHYLELHEFGRVDLRFLGSMPQLQEFALRYANDPVNIQSIGLLSQLKRLVLDGLRVADVDFLDQLSDEVELEMCGIHIDNGADIRKWKRFAKRDISEISVGNDPWKHIDLSELYGGNP